MNSTSVHTTDAVFDTPRYVKGEPLKMAARRYSIHDHSVSDGLTLLFLHGTGNHKEHWEPTIDRLYHFQNEDKKDFTIREVWALDWQTHGDSAVLNAEAFNEPFSRATVADWAAAIVDFVRVHLASHRIICVAHSGDRIRSLYSLLYYAETAHIPYESIIIIEPGIVDHETFAANPQDRKQVDRLVKVITTRRNEWASHEAAYAWFLQRAPWNTWDPRVVRLFAYKGLRPIQPGETRVTTKCDRMHEAQNLTEHQSVFQGVAQIGRVCVDVPIHAIFGEVNDFPIQHARACLTDIRKGREMASISTIPGAGHMVVQQQPDLLADVLRGIFAKSSPRQTIFPIPDKYFTARL
ncbi:hypothetical protein NM688_g5318 [Phlebia brevispora]|uniref:Uncharacterized protein n=1 Tax=Phlebia brevispora TaxID=194682 RepID=A0ACC1SXA2_9APHY|nr:hypothetical protein NM688_g5318 [Phlebia brevispora]